MLSFTATASASSQGEKPKQHVTVKVKHGKSALYYQITVDYHRKRAWYWQDTMFRQRYVTNYSEKETTGKRYLHWLAKLWKKRHIVARARAANPPHLNEWFCIHGYEGAWNDPNAPYYGGLQMDYSFQKAYGGRLLALKGTADNWTMTEQMWVAEQAFKTRGFNPWPNTARYCGLL